MQSAKKKTGTPVRVHPLFTVEPLMTRCRGDISNRDESLEAALQNSITMKLNLFNTIFRLGGFSGKRECVTNDEPREDAICNSELGTEDEDGWVKIAAYGVHPGSVAGREQYFFEEDANSVIAEFTSLRGKLGRMFRGIPIYIGHPDSRPDLYTDHRRLGKYSDLQARPDGLWAKEELNSLGLENKREGFWTFPSPRWDAPAGRARFRPTRLISVGLTNSPRLLGSEPVTNSSLDETNTKNDTIMDRKLITEKLGLDVTATDEEIMTKLGTLMTEAAEGRAKLATATTEMEAVQNSLTASVARVTALETEVTQARESAANALLDTAMATGRIAAADRPAWLPRLTGERREDEANALLGLTPVLNTTALNVEQSRIQIGDDKARRETLSNAVEGIMKTKGVSYDDAWSLAKKEPALKPLWDAMRKES